MLIRDMTIRQLWQCIGGLDRDMPVYVLGAGPGGGAELLPVRAVLLMPVTDARRVDLVRPTPRGVTPCVVLDVRDVEAAPWPGPIAVSPPPPPTDADRQPKGGERHGQEESRQGQEDGSQESVLSRRVG